MRPYHKVGALGEGPNVIRRLGRRRLLLSKHYARKGNFVNQRPTASLSAFTVAGAIAG